MQGFFGTLKELVFVSEQGGLGIARWKCGPCEAAETMMCINETNMMAIILVPTCGGFST